MAPHFFIVFLGIKFVPLKEHPVLFSPSPQWGGAVVNVWLKDWWYAFIYTFIALPHDVQHTMTSATCIIFLVLSESISLLPSLAWPDLSFSTQGTITFSIIKYPLMLQAIKPCGEEIWLHETIILLEGHIYSVCKMCKSSSKLW